MAIQTFRDPVTNKIYDANGNYISNFEDYKSKVKSGYYTTSVNMPITGVVPIPGAQYSGMTPEQARAAQQSAYTNIIPSGRTLYGTPRGTIERNGSDFLINNTETGASNLNEWKNGTNLINAASEIIKMKLKMNSDLQTAKRTWREYGRNNTTFAGQGERQFTELSPEQQADIRSQRYQTAAAHIAGLNEEQKFRETRTEDTLKYVADIYNEKIKELEAQKVDENEKKRIDIAERQLALAAEENRILNEKNILEYGLNYRYDKNGKLIQDNSNYDLPEINSKIQISNMGTGTITAYGSDLWQYGFDVALDGGKNADVRVPFDFVVLDTGIVDGGFGNQVRVKNKATGEELWISHLSSFEPLQPGRTYKAGTSVGKQGNTGQTVGKTGVHVDFTMPNNDKTYKTAEEVAVYLGIGSEKTPNEYNAVKLTDSELKDVIRITGLSESEVKNIPPTVANELVRSVKEQYKNNIRELILNGDPQKNIKPLKDEININGKTVANPTTDQIIVYLKNIFSNQLTDEEIEDVLIGMGVKKSGAYQPVWGAIPTQ